MALSENIDVEFMPKWTPEEEKRWYSLYTECALLAALINNKTTYCVFFSYSGHVFNVSMSIRASKENYSKDIADSEFCTWPPGLRQKWLQCADSDHLTKTRDRMKVILEVGEVDTSKLDFEDITEVTRYYSF